MEEKEQATRTEEVTSFREAAQTVVQSFSTGWNWLVVHMCQLFGIGKDAARNTLLIAGASLLTAVVQIVNWAYLYVHYHIGYNVPVAYLTVDTSWLVSFGVGVLLAAVFGFILIYIYYLSVHTSTGRIIVILQVVIVLLFHLVSVGRNWIEFSCLLISGGVWILFTVFIAEPIFVKDMKKVVKQVLSEYFIGNQQRKFAFSRKRRERMAIIRQLVIVIMVVLDAFLILLMYIWWARESLPDFLTKWDLAQYINLGSWTMISFYVYGTIVFWNFLLVACCALRKGAFRIHVGLMFVATVFLFFLCDDATSQKAPYAVVADSQQVVVYQSREISVLEAATITENEETDYVTLIIDTSQQQIVDSATLSYEYRTFNWVEIE